MTATQHIDIYGGKDPLDLPLYSVSDVAHHLRLAATTVRSWTVGRDYPTISGVATFAPIISLADPERRLLSFRNLVELHVLASIRRVHQVELKSVRKAVKFLRDRFRSDHPMIDREMLTDGKDLFVERYGNLVNASANGQMAMKQVLMVYLSRIDRDPDGIPIRLFPVTRPGVADFPSLVSINPRVRFGAPCIAGTGIPTSIIAGRHTAGDSIADLANDYEREESEIEEAIRYESRIAS